MSESAQDNNKRSPKADNASIKTRLSELEGKISRAKEEEKPQRQSMSRSAHSYGFRMASDMIAAPIVATFIGWWLDRFLGSSPIFLLILLLLGVAAGIFNVVRTAQEMQRKQIQDQDKET